MKDNRVYELKFRLSNEEKKELEQLMEESGFINKSAFIRNCVFNREERLNLSLNKKIEVCNKLQELVTFYPDDSRVKETTENVYNLIMGDDLHGGNKSN